MPRAAHQPDARLTRLSRRGALAALAASVTALIPACESGGHFTLLGYTTRPNYDTSIRTVRVPIFKNPTFWRGLEFHLTRAVVREVEARTPYKVVSGEHADTEILGTIVSFQKNVLNRNPLNEVREVETVLSVEVVWRDLRTGDVLSAPPSTDPNAPPPPPVLVTSVGYFIPELGESLSTSQQENVNRLAIRIVELMEKPW